MTLSSFLLATVLGLLGMLLAYGLVFLAIAGSVWLRKPLPRKLDTRPRGGDAITVLVPSHNEGEALLDTIAALLEQDVGTPVSIWVLIDDVSDASVAAMKRKWQREWKPSGAGAQLVYQKGNREVQLIACGVAPKREKLNIALPRVITSHVAFLDADHRAAANWLSAALPILRDSGTIGVQSRRRPLSTRRITQLWDSAQNHGGNEAVNLLTARAGRSVFFTGTSALFRTEALAGRKFSNTVTEDTYLSLELLLDGGKVAYAPESSTYEEVAPGLASFIIRRRRWAAGHTHALLSHLGKILRGPRSLGERFHLIVHGVFYLVPVAILPLLWAYTTYSLIQLPRPLLILWALGTILCGLAISRATGASRSPVQDFLVAALWVAPQVVAACVLLARLSKSEAYYYLLSFPFAKDLFPYFIAAILLPLLALVSASVRLGGFHPIQIAVLVVTFPVMLFFDIYASLLGAVDLVRGRAIWVPVKRENVITSDAVPESLRGTLSTSEVKTPKWLRLLWVPAAVLFALIANDLLSTNECGEQRAFLWKPLLWKWNHPVDLSLTFDQKILEGDRVRVTLSSRVRSPEFSGLTFTAGFDGVPGASEQLTSADQIVRREIDLPLGWKRHRASVTLAGPALSCRRDRAFSTTVRELRGRDLFINGEPFVVKGIIPSFTQSNLDLPLDVGLRQIKNAGANAIRVYHQPTGELLDAVERQSLLLLSQPDESTWQNVKVVDADERTDLVKRYRELLAATDGFPYLLMDNLGNELELQHPFETGSSGVHALIAEARSSGARAPVSYSTYYSFVNYPVDVLGINMLDSGETYWTKAIDLLHSFEKPFYATEFGGFVAFRDRIPTSLRVARIRSTWKRLIEMGGLGAFFYESHDNWAQALPPGFVNDPLTPEQPDDTRGIWDHENRPKPELLFVRQIFSDLTARPSNPASLPDDASSLKVTLTNVRRHFLRDVRSGSVIVGDFSPGESREATLPIPPSARTGEWLFEYTTHHGLAGRSHVFLRLERTTKGPQVLNTDFVETEATPSSVHGALVDSQTLELALPSDWSKVQVAGNLHAVPDLQGRLSIPVSGPYHPVDDLKISRDGKSWSSWIPDYVEGGPLVATFRIPHQSSGQLMLSGLGAEQVQVEINGQKRVESVHSYRDNLIDLAPYGPVKPGTLVRIEIDRNMTSYVPGRVLPSGRGIDVSFAAPLMFAPYVVDVRAQ